jgi:hypothetical protein
MAANKIETLILSQRILTRHQIIISETKIMLIANTLALAEIAPRSSQSFRILPKMGCLSIQICNRGEAFKKHHPENKIKGVVGNKGRNIPINPKNKDKNPKVNRTQ